MTYVSLPNSPFSDTVQEVIPLTTNTVTISPSTTILIINPAGTLAALTLSMPTGSYDGQYLRITSRQILSVVTMSGATIVGTLTTIAAAGGFATFRYNLADALWDRVG